MAYGDDFCFVAFDVIDHEVVVANEVDAAQMARSHQRMISDSQRARRFGEKLPCFVVIGQVGVGGLRIHQDIPDVEVVAQRVRIRVPSR